MQYAVWVDSAVSRIAQSYRSEGSWFESRSWWFTDCGLILGKCHPSSFHPQPTPTAVPQKACVTDCRFLTLYDHSMMVVEWVVK